MYPEGMTSPPLPQHPCPWCNGREFAVLERGAWCEFGSDFPSNAFHAITCRGCGYTALFATGVEEITGQSVRVPEGRGPYR